MSSIKGPATPSPSPIDAQDDGSVDVFRRLVEKIADIAKGCGIRVSGGTPASWVHYTKLSTARRETALKSAIIYHDICHQMILENRPLTDTRMLLWCSLRHFGLIPSSELMATITDDMVVELYSSEGIQLFRNLKFMEVCSYTLADIFMHPWFELFERNDEMAGDSVQCVSAVLAGESIEDQPLIKKRHRIVEAFSTDRLEIEMMFHTLSPVFLKGRPRPFGFVCTSSASVVGSRRAEIPAEKPIPLFESPASSL